MSTSSPSVWPSVPLGALIESPADLTYGIVQPGPAFETGVPMVRVRDIRDGTVDTSSPLKVNPSIEKDYARSRLRGGELLITLVGTVGETAIAGSELIGWNVARAVGIVRVTPRIGGRWVHWALQAPAAQQLIAERVNTTVQTTLNLKDLRELPIAIPPESERRSITAIVAALDDKIESNRRAIQITRALMTAHWESAEKRPVIASSVLTPVLGGTPKRSIPEYWGGGVGWASAKDVTAAAGGFILETEETITEPGILNSAAKVLPAGTIVMTARGTVGALARLAEPMAFNQSCYGLISDEVGSATLLVALQAAVSRIQEAGHGTVFNTVNMATFNQIELELPASAMTRDLMEELSSLELQLLRESRALSQLRDSLLPELMSGRIRVPETRDAAAELVPEIEDA